MSHIRVAEQTVNSLARQPTLLLVAVLNVLMLLGVGYVAKSQVDERRELVRLLADCAKEAHP